MPLGPLPTRTSASTLPRAGSICATAEPAVTAQTEPAPVARGVDRLKSSLVPSIRIERSTTLRVGSMRATRPRRLSDAHTAPAPAAMASTAIPGAIVASTVRDAWSTSETVLSAVFATHTDPGVAATSVGSAPTGTPSTSSLVSTSITATELGCAVSPVSPPVTAMTTTIAIAPATTGMTIRQGRCWTESAGGSSKRLRPRGEQRLSSAPPRSRAGRVAGSSAGSWRRIDCSSDWRGEPGSMPNFSPRARVASRGRRPALRPGSAIDSSASADPAAPPRSVAAKASSSLDDLGVSAQREPRID